MTTCANCGHAVKAAPGEHLYKVSGVEVVLSNIPIERCQSCGEVEYVIPAVEVLHGKIAAAILAMDGPLDAGRVKYLRKHKGWSIGDFAREMRISEATAVAWEAGKAAMSREQERAFRALVAESPIKDYREHDERVSVPPPPRRSARL